MRIITMMKPNGSILLYEIACLCGRNPTRTLPPSRGGIGIRLNAARTILNIMLDVSMSLKGVKILLVISPEKNTEAGTTKNLRTNRLNIARMRFVRGPAAADIAMSLFGFLKFAGLIGTGFA